MRATNCGDPRFLANAFALLCLLLSSVTITIASPDDPPAHTACTKTKLLPKTCPEINTCAVAQTCDANNLCTASAFLPCSIQVYVSAVVYNANMNQFKVTFGYNNPGLLLGLDLVDVTITELAMNYVLPNPNNRGQPTLFEVGDHPNAFTTQTNRNQYVEWCVNDGTLKCAKFNGAEYSFSPSPMPSNSRSSSKSRSVSVLPSGSITPSRTRAISTSPSRSRTPVASITPSAVPSSSRTPGHTLSMGVSISPTVQQSGSSTSISSTTSAIPSSGASNTRTPSRTRVFSQSPSPSTPANRCTGINLGFCGDGILQPGEECDYGDHNSDSVVGCSTDCTLLASTPSSDCENSVQDVTQLISDVNDARRFVAMNNYFAGVQRKDMMDDTCSMGFPRVTKNSEMCNSTSGDDAGGSPSYFCSYTMGVCGASNFTDIIVPVDLSSTTSAHACCIEDQFCSSLVHNYTSDPNVRGCTGSLEHGDLVCSGHALMGFAENMTRNAHVLLLSMYDPDCHGCLNTTEAEILTYRLQANQLLCCSASLLDNVNRYCNIDSALDIPFDWGINPYNGKSLFRGLGNKTLGSGAISYEDGASDRDMNDATFGIREVCEFASYEDDTVYYLRRCLIYLSMFARGGNFSSSLSLSFDGVVDPGNDTLRTACNFYAPYLPPNPNVVSASFFQPEISSNWNELGYVSIVRMPRYDEGGIPYTFYSPEGSPPGASAFDCKVSIRGSTGTPNLHPVPGCGTNNGTVDYTPFPEVFDVITTPPPYTVPWRNVFKGQEFQKPNYDSVVYVVPQNPSVRRFSVTNATASIQRFYLRNHDCAVSVDLYEIDSMSSDETGRPRAIFIPPGKSWCWPLEGVPISLSLTGQCVFGVRTGQSCNESFTECPLGFCNTGTHKCISGPAAGAVCTGPSQCPYGETCYLGSGAYPGLDLFRRCTAFKCYSTTPPVACTNNHCYDDAILRWYLQPERPETENVYPLLIGRYAP